MGTNCDLPMFAGSGLARASFLGSAENASSGSRYTHPTCASGRNYRRSGLSRHRQSILWADNLPRFRGWFNRPHGYLDHADLVLISGTGH